MVQPTITTMASLSSQNEQSYITRAMRLIFEKPLINQNAEKLILFDEYTYVHSLGVLYISLIIGQKMGLTEKELVTLGMGAFLHDIGKINIEKTILNKAGNLTADEYDIVKQHAEMGYCYLLQEGFSQDVSIVALEHHERIDGSGYPYQKTREDLGLNSQITAIADIFNALITKRPYRKAFTCSEALTYIDNHELTVDPYLLGMLFKAKR